MAIQTTTVPVVILNVDGVDTPYELTPALAAALPSLIDPVALGLKPYTGNMADLRDDCDYELPPPPDPDAPAPTITLPGNAPKYAPNGFFQWRIPVSNFTTAPNQSFVNLSASGGGVSFTTLLEDDEYLIYAQIPSTQTGPINLVVSGQQTDGQSASASATLQLQPATADIYASFTVQGAFGRLFIRIGPESTGSVDIVPRLTIQKAGGGQIGPLLVSRKDPGVIDGKPLVFLYVAEGMPPGVQQVTIEYLGQTISGPVTVSSNDSTGPITDGSGLSGYAFPPNMAIIEGGSPFNAAVKLNGNAVTDATYVLENARAGLSINSGTGQVTQSANTTVGDGYTAQVVAYQVGTSLLMARGDIVVTDATAVISDTIALARYQRQNGNFSPPRFVSLIAATTRNGTVQFAIRRNNETGIPASSEYQDMDKTGLFQGCDHLTRPLYAANDTKLIVFLRPKTSPGNVVTFWVPLPGSDGSTYTAATLDQPGAGTTPNQILAIFQKFDSFTRQVFLFVKSTYSPDAGSTDSPDASRIPVIRWRNEAEGTYRQEFTAVSFEKMIALPGYNFDSNLIAQGFRFQASANLTTGNPAQNVVIAQIKPYLTAPDSEIVTLRYEMGSSNDPGTLVYPATGSYTGDMATLLGPRPVYTGTAQISSQDHPRMNYVATQVPGTTRVTLDRATVYNVPSGQKEQFRINGTKYTTYPASREYEYGTWVLITSYVFDQNASDDDYNNQAKFTAGVEPAEVHIFIS